MSESTNQTFGAEHFDKVASTYEQKTEKSDPMADIASTIVKLAPAITATSIILDNASGPGVIAGAILKLHDTPSTQPKIYAADISPGMIAELQKKNWSGVDAAVMDAQNLTYLDDKFSHTFMSMGIYLLPDAEKGAAEMYRTLQPGGTAVVTSLKTISWVEIFQGVQREVKPEAALWKGPLPEEWYTAEKLKDVLQGGGFKAENIDIKTAATKYSSDTVKSFLGSMSGVVTQMIVSGWSEDEKVRFENALEKQLAKEMTDPRELDLDVWVAIARK